MICLFITVCFRELVKMAEMTDQIRYFADMFSGKLNAFEMVAQATLNVCKQGRLLK